MGAGGGPVSSLVEVHVMDADKGRMVFKSEPVSMSLEPDWQVMRREGGGVREIERELRGRKDINLVEPRITQVGVRGKNSKTFEGARRPS